ncbi:tetratricopeptide repeat protein [Roseivivax lentus]|nr:tetratricopeptide repeat protein [Roseivivax lentus]
MRAALRAGGLSLCLVFAAGAAAAQTADAVAPDLRQVEATLWNDPDADAIRSVRGVLEEAADAGDATAQFLLGRHLLNGWVLPQDRGAGLRLLEAAAAASHVEAQVDLGEGYLWGLNLPVDPALAAEYLGAAAEAGSNKAKRVLGAQLITGERLAQDKERGLSLMQQAIAAGDAEAQIALGKLYMSGHGVPREPQTALALFEGAAEAGNGHGLAAYGDALMWSQEDPARAEAILNRAGELGAGEAWLSLANGAMYGYLGGGRVSRAKFDGYAEKARAAGQERIAVLEAERNMWGINMRASGPETLARLRQAAEEGNAAAAGTLIELLRDGNKLNIRRDRAGARDALEEFGALFSDQMRVQYALSIDASEARAARAYAPMAEIISARPDLHNAWFGAQLAKANPNLAFYMLQQRMAADGVYRGAINGYATPATLRAVRDLCRQERLSENCGDNVLQPSVVGALLLN